MNHHDLQAERNRLAGHWFPDAIAEAERLTHAAAGAVMSRARDHATVEARAVVVIAARAARVSYPAIGRLLGRDPSAIVRLHQSHHSDVRLVRMAHRVAVAVNRARTAAKGVA